jgi:hypothetical protein
VRKVRDGKSAMVSGLHSGISLARVQVEGIRRVTIKPPVHLDGDFGATHVGYMTVHDSPGINSCYVIEGYLSSSWVN